MLSEKTEDPGDTTELVDVPNTEPPKKCKHCRECVFKYSFLGCCECGKVHDS